MNDLLFYALIIALLYYFFYYLPNQPKNISPSPQPQPLTHNHSTQTDPNPIITDNSELENTLDQLISEIKKLNQQIK